MPSKFYAFIFFLPVIAFGQTDSLNDSIPKEINEPDKNRLILKQALSYGKADSLKAFREIRDVQNYFTEQNDSVGMVDAYIALGHLYIRNLDLTNAGINYSQALNLSEDLDYTKGNLIALEGIADIYKAKGQLAEAENNYQKAISVYKRSGQPEENPDLVKTYNKLSAVLSAMGRYDDALTAVEKAISLAEKLKSNELLMPSYIDYANIFIRISDYEKAVNYHLKALKIAEELDNTAQISKQYNNIAVTFRRLKEYNKAISYYRKSIDLSLSIDDHKGLGLAYGNLAVAYAENGQSEKLDTLFVKALHYFTVSKDKLGQALTHHNYGNYLLNMEKFDAAEENLKKALAIREESGSAGLIASSLNVLGNLMIQKGDLPQAEKYLDKAEKLVKGDDRSTQLLLHITNLKKQLNQKKGDLQKALEYQEQELALKDKEFDESVKVNSLKAHSEYELEKKDLIFEQEKKNLMLEQEKKDLIFAQEKREQQRKRITQLGITGALLLILGLVLTLVLIRRKQLKERHQSEVQSLERQHRLELVESLSKAEQEERKKIADKLHDEVGAMLSIAKLNADQLDKDTAITQTDAKNKLNSTRKLISDVSQTIRNISHTLMPVTLEKQGLKSALQDLISDINSSGKLKIEEVIDGIDNTRLWEKQFSLMIYRMIQEILNNIIRHAQATHVLLQVVELDHSVTIYIEDNGKGFDQINTTSNGMGLMLLKQNIEFFNGKIEINSQNNKGTLILAELPVNYTQEANQ